jgi:uncharacterized membrane protein
MAHETSGSLAAAQDKRMDEIIGQLLRTGVTLAAATVIVGGVVYLSRHHVPVTNYRVFKGQPEELRSVSGIVHAAIHFRGRGLIQFGLLILIATPVARVAFSLFAFLHQRDWTYVVITTIVLGLLLYSLFGGHA